MLPAAARARQSTALTGTCSLFPRTPTRVGLWPSRLHPQRSNHTRNTTSTASGRYLPKSPLLTRRRPPLIPGKRCLHVSVAKQLPPAAPKSKDRGPKSEEDTQTDFAALNIFSDTPIPTSAVDACLEDGFALDSGLKVDGSGVLLVSGEAFKWRPWLREGRNGMNILNSKGQFEVDRLSFSVLDLVWPKPDLLVLGTGSKMAPVSPETRKHVNDLGIRLEVLDTRNAAAQFNLLATERGVQQVAAALVPVGWKEGR